MVLIIRRFPCALIFIVVLTGKGGGLYRERVQASLQDFVEKATPGGANVAVVTFENYWQEADNSLTRRLPWPRTTWIFKKGGFYSYILRNSAPDKSTVALLSSLPVDWRKTSEAVRIALQQAFVRWIVARDNLTLFRGGEPALVLSTCLAGTSPRRHVSLGGPHSASDGSSLLYDYRPHEEVADVKCSTRKTSLSGKVMKIACLRSSQFPHHDICAAYSHLFGILEAKNISLVYQIHAHWSTMLYDLYCEDTDMAVLIKPLHEHSLPASTYGEVIFAHETFYASESKIQAPSLFDTMLQSPFTIAATVASLAISVGLLVLIGRHPLHERLQTETLFLFAIFLASSTSFPRVARWPRVQNVVYLFWALAMLPLSQYIQGQLTSVVTVGRAANSLDTLDELEAALDAGVAAPCVPREMESWHGIIRGNHPTKLGEKLRASFLKYEDKLVTADLRSCVECATKNGSVCYAHRMPHFVMKKYWDTLIAFDENLMTQSCSMPLRKSFPLTYAYRAFLRRVREAGLLASPYCQHNMPCTRRSRGRRPPQTEKPVLELHGFFVFYVVILAGTVGVFVGELLFARFSTSARFPALHRGRRRER
ncbi:hypothetical protein MTO96_027056 [Rhipicephalus appendiculatus]